APRAGGGMARVRDADGRRRRPPRSDCHARPALRPVHPRHVRRRRTGKAREATAMTASAASLHLVILAAGKGTRMKSQRPKVLHRLAGLTLLEHVLDTARALSPATITVVVGHQADEVRASLAAAPD